jgi:hypothetical protein
MFYHGGGAFTGTLWNAGNNYGTLVASSYAEPNVGYRYKQMVRVCTNGTWGAWVDFSPTSFAPAGYGLGGAGTWVENLDTATNNGFYSWTDTALNKPFNYGALLVLKRDGTRITQIAIDPYMSGHGAIAIRHKASTGWYDWMYLNPPMAVGVEYKTIEKFNGK